MPVGQTVTGMSQARWLVVAAAAVVVTGGLVVAAVAMGPRLRTPQQAAADAAPPSPSVVTASAERRSLVVPLVVRATVVKGDVVKVFPAPSAVGDDSVITSVHVSAGQVLREGVLVAVRSGEPMFTLKLAFPLYRDLNVGATGPDVGEVQEALRRLGYRIRVTRVLDAPTRDAVAAFQRRVSSTAQVGDTSAGAAVLPRSAVLRIDRVGRRITTVNVGIGGVLSDPKVPVLELDGQPSHLSATLPPDQVGLASVGQVGTATDEATGVKVPVRVQSIGVTNSGGAPGAEMRLAFAAGQLSVDAERTVRVDLPASAGAPDVLAVPATAVFSRADGSTFVSVVAASGRTTDVDVKAGRSAGGWVEIMLADPSLIPAGTAVVVGHDWTSK